MSEVVKAIKDLDEVLGSKMKEFRQEITELKSDVTEIKKKNGRLSISPDSPGVTFTDAVAEVIKDNGAAFANMKRGEKLSFRTKAVSTMTIGNNLTSGSAFSSYSRKVADAPASLMHFRQLVSVVPSATGIYQFPKYGGGEGAFAVQTEGAAKGQVDYDFTMETVTANYLAGFVRVSRQMMQDLPFIQGYLPGRLTEDYLQAEDQTFYTALAAAATGSATITGTPTVDIEQILGWVANLKAANFRPTAVVLNPRDWYKILCTRPNDYSIPGGIAISQDGSIRIAGLPVYESTFIAEDKVLVGDWNQVQIVQADDLQVQAFEQDSDNVQKNLVTVRAEARVGLAILRPDAFIVGDLGNIS